MSPILLIFIIAMGTIAVVFAIELFASKNIFSGSGAPVDMAKILLQSFVATGQVITGLAIATIIAILISNNVISSEVGIAVIASIVGYLIGRNFDHGITKL